MDRMALWLRSRCSSRSTLRKWVAERAARRLWLRSRCRRATQSWKVLVDSEVKPLSRSLTRRSFRKPVNMEAGSDVRLLRLRSTSSSSGRPDMLGTERRRFSASSKRTKAPMRAKALSLMVVSRLRLRSSTSRLVRVAKDCLGMNRRKLSLTLSFTSVRSPVKVVWSTSVMLLLARVSSSRLRRLLKAWRGRLDMPLEERSSTFRRYWLTKAFLGRKRMALRERFRKARFGNSRSTSGGTVVRELFCSSSTLRNSRWASLSHTPSRRPMPNR